MATSKSQAAKDEKSDKPDPKSIEIGGETFALPDLPPPLFQLELGEQERAGGSDFAVVSLIIETFLGPEGYTRLKEVLREHTDTQPAEIANTIMEQYGVSLGESQASSTS